MSRILTLHFIVIICLGTILLAESPSVAKFGAVDGVEQMLEISGTRKISGVYPHLTTYSQSRKDGHFFKQGHQECGIGAVVPWANKLWMITYAPHMPRGSDHKLYSIDENLTMTLHPESVGGTPAARMIHHESEQLFLGHYVIDRNGKVPSDQSEKNARPGNRNYATPQGSRKLCLSLRYGKYVLRNQCTYTCFHKTFPRPNSRISWQGRIYFPGCGGRIQQW